MKRLLVPIFAFLMSFILISTSFGQGDVRSATGMPIPIGADVIWGQVELRGLRSDEPKPTIVVTLLFNGAQIATAQANDRGYYYFLQRPRDGSELLVRVGGTEIGRRIISSAGGDRYDMAVNWSDGVRNAKPGVVSVKSAYASRSEANQKMLDKATTAVKEKKYGEAAGLLNSVLKADPNDFVAWTELGSVYFTEKKLPDAEKAYTKALELKPDFMIALLNLGKLHLSEKQFDKAVPVLQKATESDPTSADAYQYLGEAFLQLKQGSKAVIVLNEAIRIAPIEKAEIHLRLATLYNAASMKDRAASEYKLFLVKKPDYPDRSKLEQYIKDNQK